MGTRSLTVFQEDGGDEIVVMYRQMDGYPSGHGEDLARFLEGINLVNGISLAETRPIANGMGCLAAQVVSHFKDGAGGFYLHTAGTRDAGEEYIYFIFPKDGRIHIKCEDAYSHEILFDGLPEDFDGDGIESARKEDA